MHIYIPERVYAAISHAYIRHAEPEIMEINEGEMTIHEPE